jgi:nicotinamide-nucleotide adenylyltransferase
MGTDAVVIGRFQPFHHGHEYLIETARDRYEDVYAGIGIPDEERTTRNPLTYTEREELLTTHYAGADNITVFGIQNQDDDVAWIREIEQHVPDDITAVTGNGHVALCFDAEGYAVDFMDRSALKDRETYSGTRIRNRVRNDEDWRHLVPKDVGMTLDGYGFEAIVRDG